MEGKREKKEGKRKGGKKREGREGRKMGSLKTDLRFAALKFAGGD